jgi:hypothetical protein
LSTWIGAFRKSSLRWRAESSMSSLRLQRNAELQPFEQNSLRPDTCTPLAGSKHPVPVGTPHRRDHQHSAAPTAVAVAAVILWVCPERGRAAPVPNGPREPGLRACLKTRAFIRRHWVKMKLPTLPHPRSSPRPRRCVLRSQAIPPSRDSAPPSLDGQRRRRGQGTAARAAAAA